MSEEKTPAEQITQIRLLYLTLDSIKDILEPLKEEDFMSPQGWDAVQLALILTRQ